MQQRVAVEVASALATSAPAYTTFMRGNTPTKAPSTNADPDADADANAYAKEK